MSLEGDRGSVSIIDPVENTGVVQRKLAANEGIIVNPEQTKKPQNPSVRKVIYFSKHDV